MCPIPESLQTKHGFAPNGCLGDRGQVKVKVVGTVMPTLLITVYFDVNAIFPLSLVCFKDGNDEGLSYDSVLMC